MFELLALHASWHCFGTVTVALACSMSEDYNPLELKATDVRLDQEAGIARGASPVGTIGTVAASASSIAVAAPQRGQLVHDIPPEAG